MFNKPTLLIAAMAIFLFAPLTLHGQDANALLDLLVKKKIVSKQEAEALRAEAAKEGPKPVEPVVNSGDKWKLSSPINELELYGDVRLRYSYNGGETTDTQPVGRPGNGVANRDDWQERERERYRLRIGLRGTLLDDWFFGVRLETSSSSRSTNVSFGDELTGGPFAKNSDGINVGQAYLGYKGFKDITLTAGRMPNPLVTTLMVWDPDINPEGLSEQWKHTFTINLGTAPAPSDSKEGEKETIAPMAAAPQLKIDVFANFGQFVYDDSNPENFLGVRLTTNQNGGRQDVPNTDAFLLAWQIGAKFTFPSGLYAQIAPTLYNYTGNGDSFDLHFQGGDPNLTNANSLLQNQTGINSLLVFDVPWEVGWKLGKLPVHLFGDFAANLDGDERAAAAGHRGKGDQRYAYQAGAGVGQLKKKGDWQLDVWYQRADQYSLDPNLIDDDIFDGRLNMHGVAARAGYALSDAVFLNLTYAHGWRADDDLGTGGTPISIAINPLGQYQLFYADLNVRF